MLLEKRRGSPFIGEKEGGNPTSNRCGIPYFSKSNIMTIILMKLEIEMKISYRKKTNSLNS